MQELILIGGLIVCGLILVVTYVFPSLGSSAVSSGPSYNGGVGEGKSLVVIAVIGFVGYFFYQNVYPVLKPDVLEVQTALKQECTVLAISVQNHREKAYRLRTLTCGTVGASDDPAAVRTVQVDQTVQPGQRIELTTQIEPSMSAYRCKQITFE